MNYKNRITGSGEEKLDDILFNPDNWRIHPKYQQDALKGVLEKVGWVQQVIVNKNTGHLVDGHLRCQLAAREGETTVPVLYVEISEQEEKLILSTLDPIGNMAVEDEEKYAKLLDEIEKENSELAEMMQDIERESRIDRSLEEIDFEQLPDNPIWVLITIPIEKSPDVLPEIDNLRLIDGVQVEQTNR
jgi:ParB-like chromosome segregation protein Spo0J